MDTPATSATRRLRVPASTATGFQSRTYRNRLGQFLRNDESVEKVIGEINAQIASLNKKYKLG